MATTTVNTRSSLLSALSSAKGGDTIVLKDGNYGSITIEADYSSPVTIRAEDRLDATISQLSMFGASNLRFDGIDFYSGSNGGNGRGIISIEENSRNIQIVNSEIHGKDDNTYQGHYGIYVRNSHDLDILNNDIHDIDSGLVVFGSKGSSIRGNSFDYFGRDAMKFGGLNNSDIQDNMSRGHVFKQSAGVHNDFIQFQGNSSDVLIDGNVFLPTTISSVQGIFLNDGTYRNIDIKNNIIYTGMLNGIYVSKGSGISVSNNTLLDVPGEIHNGTAIIVPGGSSVNNNVYTGHSGGTPGSNLKVQSRKPGDDFYVDDYFVNGSEGRGVTLQDLRPISGTLAESKGAVGRLKELLGGGAAAPAPKPEPSSPSPESAPASGEVEINAGGKAAAGFAADAYFSGGKTYKTGAGIAGTNADAVYQTERWGDFDYKVGVKNGTYDVTLHFAEIYFGKAGQRLFDVTAENRLVLDNLDVFAAAGGKNVALEKTVRVKVDDGRLDLSFDGVRDSAKVSGIEIEPASGPAPEAAPAPSGGGGGGGGESGSAVAVNAGGKVAAGFGADAHFSGGKTYQTGAGIAKTSADAVYQTERWGDFDFSVGVKNGTYDVTLHFAEIYWNANGKRVFDVKAEGKLIMDDYDVFRMAGGKNVAVEESFKVKVDDGRLDLAFISEVDSAKVSGIEIEPFDFI